MKINLNKNIMHINLNNKNNLTYELIFLFQEVGSIIGKKGEIVNRFREEVGFFIELNILLIILV